MKKLFRSRIAIYITFALAVALVIGGTIGGVRAAPLQELANDYVADIDVTPTIVMTILESVNGQPVSTGAGLLQALEATSAVPLKPGVRYDEDLSVRNDSQIPAYVRVIVYKYWTDENGNKRPDLDPSLIELNLGGSAWKTIETSASGERTILYYNGIMNTGDTAQFADGLTVSGNVIKLVHQTLEPDGTVRTVYHYDGKYVTITVEADGVQTHNAADAIRSAWGVDPSVAGA